MKRLVYSIAFKNVVRKYRVRYFIFCVFYGIVYITDVYDGLASVASELARSEGHDMLSLSRLLKSWIALSSG